MKIAKYSSSDVFCLNLQGVTLNRRTDNIVEKNSVSVIIFARKKRVT